MGGGWTARVHEVCGMERLLPPLGAREETLGNMLPEYPVSQGLGSRKQGGLRHPTAAAGFPPHLFLYPFFVELVIKLQLNV